MEFEKDVKEKENVEETNPNVTDTETGDATGNATGNVSEVPEWFKQLGVSEEYAGIAKNYKNAEEFFKAYKSLQGEFTRRSQKLKEYEEYINNVNLWKEILGEEDTSSTQETVPSYSNEYIPPANEYGTVHQEQLPLDEIITRLASTELNQERLELQIRYGDEFEKRFPAVIELIKKDRKLLEHENPLTTAFLLVKGPEASQKKEAQNPPHDMEPRGPSRPSKEDDKNDKGESFIRGVARHGLKYNPK